MGKYSFKNQHIYLSTFSTLLISAEQKTKTPIKKVMYIRTFYLKACKQID